MTPAPGWLAFGLGSNVGDSEAILRWAIAELGRLFGRLEVASLYRSAPISQVAQPDFLNTVALVSCPRNSLPNSPGLHAPGGVAPPRIRAPSPSSSRLARAADPSPTLATNFWDRTLGTPDAEDLGPEEILALAKALEMRAGRRRTVRDGPRRLDIDLLLCGEHCLSRPELTLPHPRMRQRRFVLEPLAELAPALRLPPDGAAVADLLETLGSHQPLVKIGWSRPLDAGVVQATREEFGFLEDRR